MKENLLEVALMWVNNKFETFYSDEPNNNTLDWALKVYKKFGSELANELKLVMEK
jgi:hypothetical protein